MVFIYLPGITSGTNQHQQATEENRQAIILFAIVVLFFICHLFRNILSLHEALTFEQKKKDYFHDCGGVAFGILVLGKALYTSLVWSSIRGSVHTQISSEADLNPIAEVCLANWCQDRCLVQFMVDIVLGFDLA